MKTKHFFSMCISTLMAGALAFTLSSCGGGGGGGSSKNNTPGITGDGTDNGENGQDNGAVHVDDDEVAVDYAYETLPYPCKFGNGYERYEIYGSKYANYYPGDGHSYINGQWAYQKTGPNTAKLVIVGMVDDYGYGIYVAQSHIGELKFTSKDHAVFIRERKVWNNNPGTDYFNDTVDLDFVRIPH